MAFLKLDPGGKGATAGWDEFFHGEGARQGAPTVRGFFDYYPVKAVKPAATVIATFADARAKLDDGKEQPYLVSIVHGKGGVVWPGRGETWRLRESRPAFQDRFWTGLARFAVSGMRKAVAPQSGVFLAKEVTTREPIVVRALLVGADGEPLAPT